MIRDARAKSKGEVKAPGNAPGGGGDASGPNRSPSSASATCSGAGAQTVHALPRASASSTRPTWPRQRRERGVGLGVTRSSRTFLEQGVDVMTSGNPSGTRRNHQAIGKENSSSARPTSPRVPRGRARHGEGRPAQGGGAGPHGRVFMLPIDCPFQKADRPGAPQGRPIIIVDMHARPPVNRRPWAGISTDGCRRRGHASPVQTADERWCLQGTAPYHRPGHRPHRLGHRSGQEPAPPALHLADAEPFRARQGAGRASRRRDPDRP